MRQKYDKTPISTRFLNLVDTLISDGRFTTIREFCSFVGITSQIYTNIKGGSGDVSIETVHKLFNVIKVNPTWLLFGEGEMFLPEKTMSLSDKEGTLDDTKDGLHENKDGLGDKEGSFSPSFLIENENTSHLDEKNALKTPKKFQGDAPFYDPKRYANSLENATLKPNTHKSSFGVTRNSPNLRHFPAYDDKPVLAVVVDRDNNPLITMVPERAQAGYLAGYSDDGYNAELPQISLPQFRNGTFRGFEIAGDSMFPTLYPGDWVICELCPRLSDLREGYVYVVVTKSTGIVCKRIHAILEDMTLYCRSDNRQFAPLTIAASDLVEVWLVKSRLTFQLPNPADYESRIVSLELESSTFRNRIESLEKTIERLLPPDSLPL